MFSVIVSLHVATGPVSVDNQINENTDLLTQPLFPQGWHLGALNPDFWFALLMVALRIGFNRFLKDNMYSQSQRDPNIFQTLAT